jgi:hypothetical protein
MLTNGMNHTMRKGFTYTRLLNNSFPSLKFAFIMLAAGLWSSVFAQSQVQIRRFEDKFQNFAGLASVSSTADTTTPGVISLISVPFAVSTTGSFSVALNGVDSTMKAPAALNGLAQVEVTDIDQVPGEANVYLATDAVNRRVFTYNANSGLSIIGDVLAGVTTTTVVDPVDAYPFLEGTTLKILVTDARGRVLKINTSNLSVEWPPAPANPNDPYPAPYVTPSDAVFLPQRQEILICETGKNRLIAVNMATNTISWQFDGGTDLFSSPVDVEVDPQNPDVYLVTDKDNHRIVLVQRNGTGGQIIPLFGKKGQAGADSTSLNSPTDADFIQDTINPNHNGNILICDAGNNRLLEVTRSGKIIYTFSQSVVGMTDADRLPNEQTLVSCRVDPKDARKILPKRLGYESNTARPYISQLAVFDFGRKVNFDTLRWAGNVPANTKIHLQLRAVDSPGEIIDDTRPVWRGPTGTNDFYDNKVTLINSDLDGKQFIQFRAFLETNSKLLTPELKEVAVEAHYFSSTPPGSVVSKPIGESPSNIITSWSMLEFVTSPPPLSTSLTIEILDGTKDEVLGRYPATAQAFNQISFNPNDPTFRGRQSLRLHAILNTDNASVTPKLLSWALVWNYIARGPSSVNFTNANLAPVKDYRLEGSAKDSVYIALVDPTALPLRDSVSVSIRSIRSSTTLDAESIFLKIKDGTRGTFAGGLPVVFNATATASNRRLEVLEHDTLRVVYRDPDDPADSSRATAVILRRAQGTMIVEDFQGTPIDSISIGDSLYVRILGETDQNNSPTAQDSISVLVFNPKTNDSDSLRLYEIADGQGVYNTGNFRNLRGLRFLNEGTIINNGRLAVVGGEIVTVKYVDPYFPNETPTTKSVVVRTSPIITPLTAAFDFAIAPNPFRAQRNQPLSLRAQVRTGSMTVHQIEIYNLAGEKVKTLNGAQTRLGTNATITSTQGPVIARNWWNLQGDDGATIASGTYFAKIHVRLFNQASGREEETSLLRKFVIIQ